MPAVGYHYETTLHPFSNDHVAVYPSITRICSMVYDTKIIDRQVGRNAELFAKAIAKLDSAEERYPYLRILISIIEQAHPEWNQAPQKDRQIAHLVDHLSEGKIDKEEAADVVRVRDEERGYFYD